MSGAGSGDAGQEGQVLRFRSRPDLRPVSTVVRTDRGGAAAGLIFVGPTRTDSASKDR